jgi:nucleoside-diphosphate-sugar epimerase
MPATVALTGGTGFVGNAIARMLSEAGCKLRLLIRQPSAANRFGSMDAVTVHGSLDDRDSLGRLVEGADWVVHAAGAIKAINTEHFLEVNRDGAARIAEAAARAEVGGFVLVSSLAARSPLVSAYAGSKRMGESEVTSRFGRAVVLRPPVIYGPEDRETLPMFRAARYGYFLIPGPPESRLSFIHVDDFASAVLAVITAGESLTGIYETADGTVGGYGWSEIANALAAAVGHPVRQISVPRPVLLAAGVLALTTARVTGKPLMLRPDKVNELRHPDWVCRESGLEETTGWRARFSITDGFAHTAAWYRAHGLLH